MRKAVFQVAFFYAVLVLAAVGWMVALRSCEALQAAGAPAAARGDLK